MTISTTIRRPYIGVTLNGTPLTNVLTARTQHGYNMNVAEATVVLRAMPAGIAPWDAVIVTLGATYATRAVRFTGFFVSAETQLWPPEVTLNCRGKLALPDTLEAETNVDMSSYAAYQAGLDDDYGHADEIMVSTVLHLCNVYGGVAYDDTSPKPGITGTGRVLGRHALGGSVWDWREGETGMSFIQRVDEVTNYRTYDAYDGTVTRSHITTIPSLTPAATFTEGVDIFRASYSKTILEARNKIIVEGWPGTDSKTDNKVTLQGGNQYLLRIDGSQWFQTEKFSSSMIELQNADGTGIGLGADEVAAWKLAELNVHAEKLNMTTPLDTLIAPGNTIAVAANTHLGVSKNFWVQEVDCEVSRAGAFSQVFTLVAGVPAEYAYITAFEAGAVTLPAVTALWAIDLVATIVAHEAGTLTIPAVTASWSSVWTPTILALAATAVLPAVEPGYVPRPESGTIVALNVTAVLPAVTATYVVPTYYVLTESGDKRITENGDYRILE